MTSERDLMREEFEAAMRAEGYEHEWFERCDIQPGNYASDEMQHLWEGWQAARRAITCAAEPYLWGLAAEGKSPYLDVADSRKEAETMAECENAKYDEPRYCVVPLYIGAVPQQAPLTPLTDAQKHALNPYKHSRGAASIWLNGVEAAERAYGVSAAEERNDAV